MKIKRSEYFKVGLYSTCMYVHVYIVESWYVKLDRPARIWIKSFSATNFKLSRLIYVYIYIYICMYILGFGYMLDQMTHG